MRFASVPSWRSAGAAETPRSPLPLLAAILLLAAPSIGAADIVGGAADVAVPAPDPVAVESSSAPSGAAGTGAGTGATRASATETGATETGATQASAPAPDPAEGETPTRPPEAAAIDREATSPSRREQSVAEPTDDATLSAAQPAAAPAAPTPEAPPAAAAKIAPLEPVQPRWVPLDVGNQWTYVYMRERSRIRSGGDPELELFHGTLVEKVIGNVPEFGPRAVEVQSTVRGQIEGTPAETVEKRRSFVESNGFGYRLLAVEAADPLAGKLELTRFTPPLVALKAGANVGEKWKIGSKETGGLPTELEGEVLGVQDAKVPSGVFEKCLVVQHTGAFSGAIEVYGNRIEIPSGILVITEWYAPGVGKVLAKEEINQTMVLADGSTLDYSERTQFALSSQKSGIAPADGPDGD